MAYGNLLDGGGGWQPMTQGGSMGGYSPMAPSGGSSMNLLSGNNALANPGSTSYTFGGIRPYGNVLSANRPDELDSLASGGYEAPASAGMTHEEAERAAQVVNAENAPEVAGAAMGLGQGPMSAVMSKAAQGITSAMKNTLGPYGVTGLGRVEVGTPAFAQATPAMDTPSGFTDAGARAAAFSNMNLSPQARFGGQPAPTPNMMGGIPGFSDAFGAFARDSGLSGFASGLFGDPNAVDPAAALGEVASGRAGDGRGDPGRGTNAGVGDGRGRDGGIGGGVGDVGAGNPGGTGVL